MNSPEYEALNDKLDKLAVSVEQVRENDAKLATEVASISATLRASKDRSESEIRALFVARDEHSNRLASIERSYVTREDHQRNTDQNRNEHERMNAELQSHAVQLGKVAAVASLIGGMIGVISQLVVKHFGG